MEFALGKKWLKRISIAILWHTLFISTASANNFNVTLTTDVNVGGGGNAGELRWAVNQALLDTANASTITFSLAPNSTITLAGILPILQKAQALTVDGTNSPGLTISGNDLYPVFFVHSGVVNVRAMTLTRGRSKGGNGGNTLANCPSGGGALGAGGAIFANNSTAITLTDVSFNNNSAVGGNAGNAANSNIILNGGGGGGMLGGNGGDASGRVPIPGNQNGGGGGGGGLGANGGAAVNSGVGNPGANGLLIGGTAGGVGYQATGTNIGGLNAGGGGGGTDGLGIFTQGSGGGGGLGGGNAGFVASGLGSGTFPGVGGMYGGGGGGGSSNTFVNPNGGFGGGGGGAGGLRLGSGGFGGGNGGTRSSNSNGNGGSGFGAAVFAVGGANVTFQNSAANTVSATNTVTAGTGTAPGGTSGSVGGTDIYLCNINSFTNGVANPLLPVNFITAAGKSQTFGTVGAPNTSISGANGIQISGSGTLLLLGTNDYSGGTTLLGGTLQGDFNSLQGNIINNSTGITVANSATTVVPATGIVFDTTASGNGTYPSGPNAGIISGSGGVTKTGTNTLTLGSANTFTGPVVIGGGTLNLGITNALAPTAAVPVSLTAANTQLSITAGTVQQIGDLSSSIATSLVDFLGPGAQLTVGTATPTTTFAGGITSAGAGGTFTKVGTGTLVLTGASTFAGNTIINAGTIALNTGGSFTGGFGTISANGTLQMNGGAATGAINGGTLGTPTGTLLITAPFTPNASLITYLSTINVNTPNIGTPGVLNLTGTLTLTPGENLLVGVGSTGAASINPSSSGNIANAGGLVKVGSNGTINLNAANIALGIANTGSAIVEFNGGHIYVPIRGAGATDTSTVNITATSQTDNTISGVATIDVISGTFTMTAGNTVTSFKNFTVENTATTILGGNFNIGNGTLTNNGVLTMKPGATAYSILGSNTSSVFNSNSDFISTGPINGVQLINVNGGTFTMQVAPTAFGQGFNIGALGTVVLGTNLTITANAALTDRGTFTTNGHSLIGSAGSQFVLYSSFTSTDPITNVPIIDIKSGGNFTLATPPTGFTAMTIEAGGTILLGADFPVPAHANVTTAGTFTMNGHNLSMGTGSILAINGPLSTSGTITKSAGTYLIPVGASGVFTVNNTVSGYSALTVATGGQVTLANGGSLLSGISLAGGGTFNVNGGRFLGNIAGAGNGILNVNTAFTPPGSVDVQNINVSGALTVPAGTGVTVANNLTVNAGGSTVIKGPINTGNVVNNGSISTPNTTAFQNIAGDYTQGVGGAWDTVVSNTAQVAGLAVGGSATFNGGDINVTLPSSAGGFTNNSQYKIMTATGGMTVNTLPDVLGRTLLISFLPTFDAHNFYLQAQVGDMFLEVTNPSLIGIATFLDNARGTPAADDLINAYRLTDNAQTVQELENILMTLVPEGSTNGQYLALGAAIENSISGKIFGKMDSSRAGYSAGDMAEEYSSYGPFVFGNSMKQSERNGSSGYTGFSGGFGLLTDSVIAKDTRVGIAASYACSKIIASDFTENTTVVNTISLIFYGSTEYGPLFTDGVLMVGHNYYKGRKNITAAQEIAFSNYQGSQYGGKIRGGFTMPFYNIEASPMATLQYTFLNTNAYTETSAIGLNLTQNATRASNLQLGLGGKIAEVSQADEFLPEVHAFYLVDLRPTSMQTTAQFASGGGTFVVQAPIAPRSGVNLGGSLSAKLSEFSLIILGYDLQLKKGFIDHSGSFKFRWLF